MAKNKGLTFYQKEKKIKPSMVKSIVGWLFSMLAAIFAAYVFVQFFGNATMCFGDSMMPEIADNSYVCYDTFIYLASSPKQNDVVVFLPKGNERSHFYIKRVVACPGDRVKVEDKILYVNDVPSTIIVSEINDAGIAMSEITLGEDEYFCMGDVPSLSEDSRNANVGVVKKNYILGKVWCSFMLEDGKKIRLFRWV